MARKALLVGLNRYPEPENCLRGCLNDVAQVSDILEHRFGFEGTRDVRLLTDRRATTSALRERLRWLVSGARPGDLLVFHYSGHGAQVRDRHGDELSDGLDEVLCPYDFDWDQPFTDDDLYEAIKDVPAGVNLTILLDCCHAGTGIRDFRSIRCLTPPIDIAHRMGVATSRSAPSRLRKMGSRAVEAGAILLAACRDSEVSADAYIDGSYHGAFTYYLGMALERAAFAATYERVTRDTRQLLRENGFSQVPQLEGPPSALKEPSFEPFSVSVTA